MPPQQPFFDFLTLGTLGVQILKSTRVRAPNEPDVVPFVALRRESVILVVPPLTIVNLMQAVGISEMQ